MKERILYTSCLEETHSLGKKLGELAESSMVFLLDGDLGAGKTALTQGIAMGLGVQKRVTSPTFTIQKIYKGRLTLNHIDAYRLEGLEQDLGFDEYLNDEGLTVIEWPQFVPGLIPDEYMKISIELMDGDSRQFSFFAHGNRYEHLLEELA